MLREIEAFAAEARLHLRSRGSEWAYCEDWPHITTFHYELATYEGDEEKLVKLGWADGYRITQDWSVEDVGREVEDRLAAAKAPRALRAARFGGR